MVIIDNREFDLPESHIWRHNISDFIFALDLLHSSWNDYVFFKNWNDFRITKDITIITGNILETFYGCNISLIHKIAEIKFIYSSINYNYNGKDEILVSFEDFWKNKEFDPSLVIIKEPLMIKQ